MNNKIFQAVSYFKFLRKSGNRHAVHPPFVYKMADEVLRKKVFRKEFVTIEARRYRHLTSGDKIQYNDLGAGSRSGTSSEKKIKTIAKFSLSTPKQCRLMYRLAAHYQAKTIVEIGTSLGISAAYLALVSPETTVYTLEGSEPVLSLAKNLFESEHLENITPILGDFKNTLPTLISSIKAIDFAFIDGNHTYENTLDYFEQILTKSHNETMILIDDIYWSEDMQRAWTDIKKHPKTRTTIDLFDFGIVLLREEMTLQHFMLRYSS